MLIYILWVYCMYLTLFSVEWLRSLSHGPEECIYVYRCCKLWNELHNIVFGSLFLPAFKLCLLLALFVTAYCVIRLQSSLTTAVYMTFLIYFVTIAGLILPGAMVMTQVYSISAKLHQNMRDYYGIDCIKGKWRKKSLRFLSILKSRIGSFYHMEGKAKLTLAYNIAQVISFILIYSSPSCHNPH